MTAPAPSGSDEVATTEASVTPSAPAGLPTGSPTGTGEVTPAGTLEPEAVEALQHVLAIEHAAIWSYGLISAYSPGDATLVETNRNDHIFRRDATAELLLAVGATPVQPLAAYHTPLDVTDVNSARELARIAEDDSANAWRATIAATDSAELRNFALTGLSDSAVRLAMLRKLGNLAPFTKAFPGVPK